MIGVARSEPLDIPLPRARQPVRADDPACVGQPMSTMNEFELAAWSEMAEAGELRRWLVSGRWNNLVKYQRVLRERAEKIRGQ